MSCGGMGWNGRIRSSFPDRLGILMGEGGITMTERAAAAVNYTLATHAAERMEPSQKAIHLCEEIAEGHISGDYAVRQLLLSYGIESKACHD